MKKITIKFTGHEQANAFMLWLTEEPKETGFENFKKSHWAKVANMFDIEIESDLLNFEINIK